MTTFFDYALLTWPEVAALPRATPLCLPLGEDIDLTRLAATLGNPPRAGLLPSIPFGWRGSGLAVDDGRLGAVLRGLVDSLRDDGFGRVYVVTPQGADFDLGAARIALPHPSHTHPAALLPADHDRDKVVLIPIGHTEQHGYHLPLRTDTVIIGAIARGVVQRAPAQCVTLPAFPYGVSTHRAAF
ncbi:MAG TPA: creatininase family protein, partial [Caldilinea sp.]|nr:creatininase family protein [Caldilinea sp.]